MQALLTQLANMAVLLALKEMPRELYITLMESAHYPDAISI
jgi:hypothetical protein